MEENQSNQLHEHSLEQISHEFPHLQQQILDSRVLLHRTQHMHAREANRNNLSWKVLVSPNQILFVAEYLEFFLSQTFLRGKVTLMMMKSKNNILIIANKIIKNIFFLNKI
jgi:hypothetical protein